MNTEPKNKSLSIIIPVCERAENAIATLDDYKTFFDKEFPGTEYIFVVNDTYHAIGKQLEQLNNENLAVLFLTRDFAEVTPIRAGFDDAKGDLMLILPPYKQVTTDSLGKLFEKIEETDIVLARRWPRVDTKGNQFQTGLFNKMIRSLSDQNFSDIGCGVRLIRAEAAKELDLYGDQHRFLPLLAYQIGFTSSEVDTPQAEEDKQPRVYSPGVYLRRFLDLLTVVFLTKFNKKPLRFFGLLGSGSIGIGALGLIYLAFERLALGVEVSDRPLLVLFCLFLVLGFQLLAIGLVGEIIIFTHAGNNKEYRVKHIFNFKE